MITPILLRYYEQMQQRYPSILWRGDASRRAIALTFDDGPHPRDTPGVLDVLGKHNVRATFHLVGQHAEQHPGLLQEIHQRGHQLALHCYRHLPFPLERPEALRTQLARTKNIISEVCGVEAEQIKDLRPPYGAFNQQTFLHLTAWAYRLVMWSCIPPHWMQPVGWSIRQLMEAVVPGAVIVLHDGHGHGRRVREIVDAVVPRIQSLGYEFVTVEEMQEQRAQLAAS